MIARSAATPPRPVRHHRTTLPARWLVMPRANQGYTTADSSTSLPSSGFRRPSPESMISRNCRAPFADWAASDASRATALRRCPSPMRAGAFSAATCALIATTRRRAMATSSPGKRRAWPAPIATRWPVRMAPAPLVTPRGGSCAKSKCALMKRENGATNWRETSPIRAETACRRPLSGTSESRVLLATPFTILPRRRRGGDGRSRSEARRRTLLLARCARVGNAGTLASHVSYS